jgi:hypothetical protein
METAFLFEVIVITVYLNEWCEKTVDQFRAKRDQVAKLLTGVLHCLVARSE